MASSDSDSATVVLRPGWLASASVGPLVAVILVSLALVFDKSVVQALVFATVFGLVFAFFDRRRTVVLSDAAATVKGVWRQRSIARTDVREVGRGPWWNGAIRLSTGGKNFWLPVGDQLVGRVSDQRLAVVKDWAAGAKMGR